MHLELARMLEKRQAILPPPEHEHVLDTCKLDEPVDSRQCDTEENNIFSLDSCSETYLGVICVSHQTRTPRTVVVRTKFSDCLAASVSRKSPLQKSLDNRMSSTTIVTETSRTSPKSHLVLTTDCFPHLTCCGLARWVAGNMRSINEKAAWNNEDA